MPSDQSTSVGAMLRAARERQGLSVNDIAERTRIRSTLIREIESDNFFGCGDTFYARGHVRSIAVTVGVDPGVALAEFDAAHGPSVPQLVTEWLPAYDPVKAKAVVRPAPTSRRAAKPAPMIGRAAKPAPTPRPAAKPAPTIRRAAKPAHPAGSSPSWRSAIVAAAAVVALLAAASFLIGYTQGSPPRTAAPLPDASQSPPAAASVSPSVQPTIGVNLQIRVTDGSSYLRVTNSNRVTIYEGELRDGDVKDFTDPRQLDVRYGNSTVVTVVVNGVNKGSPSCGAVVCSETYKLAGAD